MDTNQTSIQDKQSEYAFDALSTSDSDAFSVGKRDDSWLIVSEAFSNEQILGHFFAQVEKTYPGADLKAQSTLLLGVYTYEICVALVDLMHKKQRVPELDPTTTGIRFNPVAITKANGTQLTYQKPQFRTFTGNVLPTSDDLDIDLASQLERHFTPIVSALSEYGGMGEGALWKVISDSICTSFLVVGENRNCQKWAQATALSIVHNRNYLLYSKRVNFLDIKIPSADDPESILAQHTFLLRGGCCRFYTIEGQNYCSTCVFLKPKEREERLYKVLEKRTKLR